MTKQEHTTNEHVIQCSCKIQWNTIYMLTISLLGNIAVAIFNSRKLKLFRGHLFSNKAKVMLFISDVQHYVPVTLCRTAGIIHLFTTMGKLTEENVKLRKNILWYILELE